MPKNRHLTYSDQQSQAAHEAKMKKLQALLKKAAPPAPTPTPEPTPAPAKKKATKKKAGTKV